MVRIAKIALKFFFQFFIIHEKKSKMQPSLLNLVAGNLFGNSSTPEYDPCNTPDFIVEDSSLYNLWRVVYWSSQLLTWIFLPLMQVYRGHGVIRVQGSEG